MTALPNLIQAYAILLQEENQRDSVNHLNLTAEHVAMNAKFTLSSNTKPKFQSKWDNRKGNDVPIVCDYCKFTGHTKDKCFALHGYQEWHRLYGQPMPKVRAHTIKKIIANAVNSKSDVMSCK